MVFEYNRNRAFLKALEQGCLGYSQVARFEARPWVAKQILPSLAPTILIYAPEEGGAGSAPASEQCRQLTQTEQSPSPEDADDE